MSVPARVVSAARGIAFAGGGIMRAREPIGSAATAIHCVLEVGISAPTGGVFAAADAFANSLLGKRVWIVTQAAPALIEPAVRVGDPAIDATLFAPIVIVSARAGLDRARAVVERAARAILRAPFRLFRAPSHASHAAVRMSPAIARNSAVRSVARSMRSRVPSG